MAANKLKYSDLDSGALEQLIANLREAKKEYDNLIDSQKEVLKQNNKLIQTESKAFENVEKIKATEKAINEVETAVKQLDDLEKKRIKTEKALLELDDERAKQNAILTQQLNEKRKALREEAKAATELQNSYKDLTKETNAAQAEFKKLAVQFGLNSKEAIEAQKRFDKLDKQLREVNDAARDGRRDVGRYRIATEKLNNSLKKFGVAAGAIMVITKAFEGLQNVIGNNADAGVSLEKVLGTVTITFTVLLSRLTKAFPLLIDFVKNSFNGIKIFFKEMQLSFLETTNILGRNKNDIIALKKEIAGLSANFKDVNEIALEFDKIFEGLGDEIAETVEKNNRLIDATLAYRRQVLGLSKEIVDLQKEEARLTQIRENDSVSLTKQIQASKDLEKVSEDIAKKELEIANQKLKLAKQNLGVFNQSIDAQEQAAAAYVEVVQKEIELENTKSENLARQGQIRLDLMDLEIDSLNDFADNTKTINERIIADESETYAKRNERLQNIQKDTRKSLEAITQEFIDAENDIRKLQDPNFTPFSLNLDELLAIDDTLELERRLKALDPLERTYVQLLTVIKDFKTATQDNIETEKDFAETQTESLELMEAKALNERTLQQLKEDGVDVELVLQKLEEKRLEMEIQNLKLRIAASGENTEERLKLEKELSEKLLEEQQTRLEKEKTAEEKAAEQRKEIQEGVADFLEKLNEKIFSKRISKIEEAIDKEKEREDQLRELARQGVQDAENNLAVTQKRQAELEREREQALKRQKAFELGLAAARAYSANVASGDGNALVKTITDISLLEAFIDNLAGFYEGTDLVKNDLNPSINGKDGYVIRVDGDERIFNPAQNKAVQSLGSNLNNWELVRLAQVGKSLDSQNSNLGDNAAVLQGLNSVKRAIESKPSYLGREYDRTERSVIDTFQEKGRVTRKHYKKAQGFLSKPD